MVPGDGVLRGSIGGELHAKGSLSGNAVGVDVAIQVLLAGSGKLCVGLHHADGVTVGKAKRVLPALRNVGFDDGLLDLDRVDGIVVGVDGGAHIVHRPRHEQLVLVNGVGLSKREDWHQAEKECVE